MIDQSQVQSSVGAPPPPEMTIRTMKSDIASLKASGGMGAIPTTFRPSFSGAPEGVLGYLGQRENREEAASHEVRREEPLFIKNISMEAMGGTGGGNGISKIIFTVAVALLLIGVFWVLGYYIIFPWLFPAEMPTVQ